MIQFPNKNMSVVENQIVERLVTDILAAGLTVSVYDGEEYPLRHSTDMRAIMDALASTDMDELVLHEPKNAQGLRMRKGWVSLVWGNDCDVISDYTTNIEAVMRGANALANRADDIERGFVKPTAPTTARFWVYTHKGLARIKLRKGQSLTHVEGGPTDDGYSYTSTTWSFDDDRIVLEWATKASDCDGPISRGGAQFALLAELKVLSHEECKHAFPAWQSCEDAGWQRDAFAEAAGY
jgi:hypothetical protein